MSPSTPQPGNGSRAKIYKQDPSVTNIGLRLVYIPSGISPGPKDPDIEIVGLKTPVAGDKNGDFIYDKDTEAFDAVHTFTVVRQVLTMYQRALKRIGQPAFTWQWEDGPIKVSPLAGVDKNAYYSRTERAMKFFYFKDTTTKKVVHTNRSFDVVAHEAGHAILDGLRPGYWASWQPQTGGLHEAFGDITAILTMLSQLDQCESIIVHSKADLHVKSFFNAVAEQFGEALYGHRSGLRNADNNKTLEMVTDEVHDISQVFTGAFYDILADIFEDMRDHTVRDDAETLFRAGEKMADLLLLAILRGPAQNATYADIANRMITVETNRSYKQIIRKHFEVRQVLGSKAIRPPKKPNQALEFKLCHCTLSSKEHVDAVTAAMANKKKGWFGRSSK